MPATLSHVVETLEPRLRRLRRLPLPLPPLCPPPLPPRLGAGDTSSKPMSNDMSKSPLGAAGKPAGGGAPYCGYAMPPTETGAPAAGPHDGPYWPSTPGAAVT